MTRREAEAFLVARYRNHLARYPRLARIPLRLYVARNLAASRPTAPRPSVERAGDRSARSTVHLGTTTTKGPSSQWISPSH